MNTPSHLIMTAAVRKGLRHIPIAKGGWLLGAVAPDLPLYLLSVGGGLYYRFILGWTTEATFSYIYDTLYFTDPFWMATHNLLHAPFVLLAGLALSWRGRFAPGTGTHWWFWFFLACLFHTSIDIATHVLDGPLLLFPFQWTMRFHSPVSYWDPRYYGRQFTIFELCLDVVLLGYLFIPVIRRRFLSRATRNE